VAKVKSLGAIAAIQITLECKADLQKHARFDCPENFVIHLFEFYPCKNHKAYEQ
jgi:hypothetical protein